MKHLSANRGVLPWAAGLGLATVFACLTAASPARADFWDDHHDRAAIHYDIASLHRDQAHLRDLQHRRDVARRHHDRDEVRRLDVAIDHTRWRIAHKSFDVRHDFDTYYSDPDRNWFYDRYR